MKKRTHYGCGNLTTFCGRHHVNSSLDKTKVDCAVCKKILDESAAVEKRLKEIS
jgi:hypothetical protein